MNSPIEEIQSLSQMRTYVHETLCAQENLLLDQFPLVEVRLNRGGKDCGLQFFLQGPRSVRLGAIWASDHNVVYFYDTKGERFQKTALIHRFSVEEASAAPAA